MSSTALLALLAVIFLASCAPGGAPQRSSASPSAPLAPKTLTIALQGEPANVFAMLGGDIGGSPAGRIEDAIHQHLVTYNHRGEARPALAAELPSQARGTWTVRQNGTMQTTWRLRPGITWHDGTPLIARDVQLGWSVSADPELPVQARSAASQVSRVDVLDDLTFAVEWTRVYPLADQVVDWDFGPLPSHLLDEVYPADKERFTRAAYWNREFIGLGPFALAEWQLGSHIIVRRYEGFFRGPARIDSITFKFIPNEPTVVANLLAGTIDGQFRAISFNQVMFVKEQWEALGKRPVAIPQPTTWRVMEFQYRDQFRDPTLRDLADPRARRALLHAVDRRALVEHQYRGEAPVSDTFVVSTDVKWEWVKDAVTRYDYDPARAQEGLAGLGWQRGSDGGYMTSAGDRVTIPLSTTEGGQWQDEIAIVADYWKSLGLGATQEIIPSAQSRDRRLRASFSGFSSTSLQPVFLNLARSFHSSECGTEQSRWIGNNRGCYQNPATDRIVDQMFASVDPSDHRRLAADLVRLQTEELPGLPLYFTVQVIFFREGVTGVLGGARPTGSDTWNIDEWDVAA